MDYSYLPKKYWKKQDYLLYIYDVLGDMLRQADAQKLSEIEIEIVNKEQYNSLKKSDDMFLWMDQNGYHDLSLRFFRNHVFFSLLRDFCYYVYESLSCAARGKVTVSYTLLRKPLKDNLLYLEWLLSDPEEFYQAILYNDIDQYDVSNSKVFTGERIQSIINSASEKSYMGKSVNYDNLIYTFRFNSKDDTGLQRIWNQSIHLVTKKSDYKTDRGNLNFIFADNEIWNDYWDYYYLVMPQLMAYVLEICEALFIQTIDVGSIELILNRTIRFAKYAHVNTGKKTNKLIRLPQELINLIDDNMASIYLTCENCKEKIRISKDIIQEMTIDFYIPCNHCGFDQSICRYYTNLYLKNSGL